MGRVPLRALDELVSGAGVRLAESGRDGTTRRGLLGAAAAVAGGGAVLSARLAGDLTEPAEAAPGPVRGCQVGRSDINVCYAPWRVVRSEPAELLPAGLEGVAVRKGPEPDAPIIYKLGDPCIVPVGSYFGRQSRRDGGVSRGCPDPGPRPARGGFVFGYPAPDSGTHNKGGWLAARVGGRTYSVSDDDYRHVLCGPADLDFDCRAGAASDSRFKTACGVAARPGSDGYECGGSGAFAGTCTKATVWEIGVEVEPDEYGVLNDLSHERYNLKYEADGTTIFWLVPGDVVRRYCRKCTQFNPSRRCPVQTYDPRKRNCCRAYSCIEVVRARYVPVGTQGWINSSVLRRPGGRNGRTSYSLRRVAAKAFSF